MDDNDFLDLIYSQWAKTTGAEVCFWMYDEDPYELIDIYAVDEDQSRNLIASSLRDEDADFITAVHGCFPDLIRKIREALDEADRLDLEKDELIGRVAELELEIDTHVNTVLSYSERIKELESLNEGLANENLTLEREIADQGWMNETSIMDRWLDNDGTV